MATEERPHPAAGRAGWRRMRRVLVLLGAVLLADLSASVVIRHISRLRIEQATLRAQAAQEPYRDTEWGQAYWREITTYTEQWDPYVVYRVGEMRGRFINVADGVRRTYAPSARPDRRRRLVFLFGGSAAWGHGARDLETLPSWLARVGEEHGDVLEVRNYAESGWVNWQGIVYLMEKLAADERPNVVVFYSGVNEMLSALQWPRVRRPILSAELYVSGMTEVVQQRNRPLLRAWAYYRRTSLILSTLVPAPTYIAPAPRPSLETLTTTVTSDYAAEKAMVEALGRAFGFSTLFVWQLTVSDKAELSGQERRYAGWLPSSPDTTPAIAWWSLPADLRAAYDAIGRNVKSHGVIDLSPAFHGMSTSAFIDWMHPSEQGIERIARALYEKLAPAGSEGRRTAALTEPAH